MNIQDFNSKNRTNMVDNITENKMIREMNDIITEANEIFPLFESVLDPIQKYRCDTLFGSNNKEKSPKIKEEPRNFMMKIAQKFIDDINIPGAKIEEFFMVGSSLGYQYREDSDFDCDLRISLTKDQMRGKFSLIPKNIFYPNTSHPINIFLLCKDDQPYNFEEHCENAYDLLKNEWIKQGFLRNEYPIPYSYISGVSEFIMDGITLQMQRADRHIQDIHKYISLDPNKVEISARERIDAIADSINDLKIDMDALNLSHRFLFRFDGEGFNGDEFRVSIDYKASAKHYTINNLIYKYIDGFGYYDKINEKIKEIRTVIEKAENELKQDKELEAENVEHERVQKEIKNKTLKEAENVESVNDKTTVLNNLRSDIQDEYTAIKGYDAHADFAEKNGCSDIAEIIRDIRDEEKVHIGELEAVMKKYDKEFKDSLTDGGKEAEEVLKEGLFNKIPPQLNTLLKNYEYYKQKYADIGLILKDKKDIQRACKQSKDYFYILTSKKPELGLEIRYQINKDNFLVRLSENTFDMIFLNDFNKLNKLRDAYEKKLKINNMIKNIIPNIGYQVNNYLEDYEVIIDKNNYDVIIDVRKDNNNYTKFNSFESFKLYLNNYLKHINSLKDLEKKENGMIVSNNWILPEKMSIKYFEPKEVEYLNKNGFKTDYCYSDQAGNYIFKKDNNFYVFDHEEGYLYEQKPKKVIFINTEEKNKFLKENMFLTEDCEYTRYVKGHIRNLKSGYRWLKKYLPEIFPKGYFNDENRKIRHAIRNHDKSKWGKDEYKAYSDFQKIRKIPNLTDEEYDAKKGEFNIAWNHHQKGNRHHWQYWVLQNANGTTKVLDMPYENIIEMICDWWTFSWKENNLYSIFDWYARNKDQMILSPNTKSKVENILDKMKKKINEQEKAGMLKECDELANTLELDEILNEEWSISDFDTAESIGRELERLHTEKEDALKNDDKPSTYYENIDKHIEQLKDKMKDFDCKCERITESRLPEDGSDPQFGVPQQKKYPLYDKTHVEAAIKLFGHVDAEYEQQLARAIIVKMKKYGISYDSVSPNNKLYKWIPESYKTKKE